MPCRISQNKCKDNLNLISPFLIRLFVNINSSKTRYARVFLFFWLPTHHHLATFAICTLLKALIVNYSLPGVSKSLHILKKDCHINAKFHCTLMENRCELFRCPVLPYNTSDFSTAYKTRICLIPAKAYPCDTHLWCTARPAHSSAQYTTCSKLRWQYMTVVS